MDNIRWGVGRFCIVILGVYEVVVASNISFALRRGESDTVLMFIFAAFVPPLIVWAMCRASLWACRSLYSH